MTGSSPVTRLLQLGIIVGLVSAYFVFGLNRYPSLDVLRNNDVALHVFVADHPFLSATAFITVYASVDGLSLPGGNPNLVGQHLLDDGGLIERGLRLRATKSVWPRTQGRIQTETAAATRQSSMSRVTMTRLLRQTF
jgi:hypothetical protein